MKLQYDLIIWAFIKLYDFIKDQTSSTLQDVNKIWYVINFL